MSAVSNSSPRTSPILPQYEELTESASSTRASSTASPVLVAESIPAGIAAVPDSIAPVVDPQPPEAIDNLIPALSIKDRLGAVWNKLISGATSAAGALFGVVKSIFTYITSVFSRSKTAESSAKSKEVDIADKNAAIRDAILAQLTEAECGTYLELNSDESQHVLDKAIVKYTQVVHAKTCHGETLTSENREKTALKEAAKVITSRL